MFMITPKPTSPSSNGSTSSKSTAQSHNHTKQVRIRVPKACDRCRFKKIKCDGEIPCVRCRSDAVVCALSRRKANDPKALSREYISSLESQQVTLVKALQQIYGHIRQPNGEKDARNILEKLKAEGCDLDGLINRLNSNEGLTIDEGRQYLPLEPDWDTLMGDIAMNGNALSSDGSKTSPTTSVDRTSQDSSFSQRPSAIPKQRSLANLRSTAESTHIDDYWNLEDYWGHIGLDARPSSESSLQSTGVRQPENINLGVAMNSSTPALPMSNWIPDNITDIGAVPTGQANLTMSSALPMPTSHISSALPMQDFSVDKWAENMTWWDMSVNDNGFGADSLLSGTMDHNAVS